MLQLGILPEGYIFPREERQLRDLLRKLLKLVRQRTIHILSFKSLVSRNQGISMGSDKIKMLTEESIDGMFENEHLAISAKANIAIMNYLKEKIVAIEKQIRKMSPLV